MPRRVAVIDLGSNTATLAVFEGGRAGGLDRVAQFGESLRLIRRLGPDRRFPESALARTVEVVRGYVARARGLGANEIEVVCTSAVRDAVNQEELLARLRAEAGVPARVLDGESEGVGAVVSAVHTLPVTDGFVVDLGGGSLQIAHVTTRRARQVVSLPLGALRLSDAFFGADPPTADAVTALRRHLQSHLAQVPWFDAAAGGSLVGVGGGLRVLAKIERRGRGWPVDHGHGFRLSLDAVEAIWERVSRLPAAERAAIPGLSAHRVDTVCASAMVAFLLLRTGGFAELRMSTYGIREGVALRRLHGDEGSHTVADVRLAGLTGRFPVADDAAARLALAQVRAATQGTDHERWMAALCITTWVAMAGVRPARAVETLLTTPVIGFWQEEILAAADLVGEGPPRVLGPDLRATLRALVRSATGVGAPR